MRVSIFQDLTYNIKSILEEIDGVLVCSSGCEK